MLNVATVMGRLVTDPELKHTQSGVPVTSFTLAIDRRYAKQGEDRQTVQVEVTAKSKLEPTSAVKTSLYITGDQNGQPSAVEMVPQIPGQQYLDGGEQEAPAALRLIQ